MSEEEKPLEFSAHDFMPDWVRNISSAPPKWEEKSFREESRFHEKAGSGRRGRQDGREDRSQGRRRNDFGGKRGQEGGGYRSERGDKRDGRDRRESRDGNLRDQGPRRGQGRGREPREERENLMEGIVATVEPSRPAVEGLVRHIRETLRSFPVPDLAKMLMEARERYRVRFTATEPRRLHQCLADGSLWLSREEAINHLLTRPALENYYQVEEIQVDAPSGNYAVIAVCGMTGTVLGPPNHHEYQRNIAKLHREKFSHMALERFKSRIQMESGAEIVDAWKETMSRAVQYRVKEVEQVGPVESQTQSDLDEKIDQSEQVDQPEQVEPQDQTEPQNQPEQAEPQDQEAPQEGTDQPDEHVEQSPQAPAPAGIILRTMDELRRHFMEHFSEGAVIETAVAVVPGNISGALLSPGLLVHLKRETERMRRTFPLPLIQSLCREFESHGLRFFKTGKKALHVSVARPKVFDENLELSESIRGIVQYIKTTEKPTVAGLLASLVPNFHMPENQEEIASAEHSEEALAVLKNLRWLTSEGYVLEFSDTSLSLGRAPQVAPAPEAQIPKEAAAKKEEASGKKQEERKRKRRERKAAIDTDAAASDEGESDSGDDASAIQPEGIAPDPNDPYELPDSVNPVDSF